jgi:hypothetical protein
MVTGVLFMKVYRNYFFTLFAECLARRRRLSVSWRSSVRDIATAIPMLSGDTLLPLYRYRYVASQQCCRSGFNWISRCRKKMAHKIRRKKFMFCRAWCLFLLGAKEKIVMFYFNNVCFPSCKFVQFWPLKSWPLTIGSGSGSIGQRYESPDRIRTKMSRFLNTDQG